MKAFRDRTKEIPLDAILQAKESLIQRRETHLDQLADKLREERVRRVISAILSSDDQPGQAQPAITDDDQQYLEDLGLIVTRPWVKISNPIYSEIIPRQLTMVVQSRILPGQETHWYLTPDNRLNMVKLLDSFQQFFRENSDSWIERFDYKEAGPQLLIQAFLQRITNGGGRISREYGLGRGRMDIFIEWPTNRKQGFTGSVQRIVIELKIKRGQLDTLLPEALEQTGSYAATAGADEGHLVIFNRDQGIGWDEKIWHKEMEWNGQRIDVWGC